MTHDIGNLIMYIGQVIKFLTSAKLIIRYIYSCNRVYKCTHLRYFINNTIWISL